MSTYVTIYEYMCEYMCGDLGSSIVLLVVQRLAPLALMESIDISLSVDL